MQPSLIQNNQLVRTAKGIWRLASNHQFEYSDGDAYETFLKEAILSTRDRSSQSPELMKKYAHWDWVSEYHLSPQRANLIRSLDLKGVENALELGCGCGAITRYLGELGILVDAIEGAPRRAEIARYRCQDLENVAIINANFNALTYPEEAYDAVFLIGVLEYAKRFQPEALTHLDAVHGILSFAKKTLKPDGVIIIAIENRLGMKYWLGASEDHYGSPYTGLYGYPGRDPIRTYDKKEWGRILEDTQTEPYRFAYPFPDYKMPRAVLFDHFIQQDAFAYSPLYGLASRDYLRLWQPEADEFLIWKSLHQSGYLTDFANSFLIICAHTTQRLDRATPNDFVYFSNPDRKPIFRTITKKPYGQDYILKQSVTHRSGGGKHGGGSSAEKTPYFTGRLLATIWLESIAGDDDPEAFEGLLKAYYAFICDYFGKYAQSYDAFDLLPFNIIVDDCGTYQVIDQEWAGREGLSPEYIFFRALMWFSQTSHWALRDLCRQKEISNVQEFIKYGFSLFPFALGLSDERLDSFIDLEENMQAEVIYQNGLHPVRRMIEEPFQLGSMSPRPGNFTASLYWEDQNQGFNDKNSIDVSAPLGKRRQRLVFNLFFGVRNLRRIRLKPVNRPGFFRMFSMTLKWISLAEDDSRVIWQQTSAHDMAKEGTMVGMCFSDTDQSALFISTGDHPLMTFELPASEGIDIYSGRFQFEVEMDWPKTEDVAVAEGMLEEVNCANAHNIEELMGKLAKEVQKNAEQQIQHLKKSQIKDRLIAELSSRAEELHGRANQAETVLNDFLNSKLWKSLKPLRWLNASFRRVFFGPTSTSDQEDRLLQEIESSGLFDPAYYYHQNPDLLKSGGNPIMHYLNNGVKTGKNPHHLFDSQYYLANNPDVAESGINPLAHYLENGSKEGRSPHPLFDMVYYLGQNPEIKGSDIDPLRHYLQSGVHESKNPHPLFDTRYYLDLNPDVAESGVNPLMHYLSDGASEGRSPHPLFDTVYYLNQHPGLQQANTNPLTHYLANGPGMKGDPHPLFDTGHYLAQNPEIVESGIDPITHYVEWGALNKKYPHRMIENFGYKPKISIIKAVRSPNVNTLHHVISAVIHQLYGHWQLCLLKDSTLGNNLTNVLNAYADKDPRIILHRSARGYEIANTLNEGLSASRGDFILFLDDDDKLTVDALYEFVRLINDHRTVDFIHSNEDKLDIRGVRLDGFSETKDRYLSSHHFGHLALFRRTRLVEVGELKAEHERFYDHDVLLRFIKDINPHKIGYIPKRLYY